jgi:hypothetical protein
VGRQAEALNGGGKLILRASVSSQPAMRSGLLLGMTDLGHVLQGLAMALTLHFAPTLTAPDEPVGHHQKAENHVSRQDESPDGRNDDDGRADLSGDSPPIVLDLLGQIPEPGRAAVEGHRGREHDGLTLKTMPWLMLVILLNQIVTHAFLDWLVVVPSR